MVPKKPKKRALKNALISALETQKRLRAVGPAIGSLLAIDPPSIDELKQSAGDQGAIALDLVSIPDPKQSGPGTNIELSFSLRGAKDAANQKATGSVFMETPTSKATHFLKHVFASIARGMPDDFLTICWGAPKISAQVNETEIKKILTDFAKAQLFDSKIIAAIAADVEKIGEQIKQLGGGNCRVAIGQDGIVANIVITKEVHNPSKPKTVPQKTCELHLPQAPLDKNIAAPFVMQARSQSGSYQWSLQYTLDCQSLEYTNGSKMIVTTEVEDIALPQKQLTTERKVS